LKGNLRPNVRLMYETAPWPVILDLRLVKHDASTGQRGNESGRLTEQPRQLRDVAGNAPG
jgi:hypothetical protein